LQKIAARVERLAAEHAVDEPAPAPDDPHFMAWAVEHYGLARLLDGGLGTRGSPHAAIAAETGIMATHGARGPKTAATNGHKRPRPAAREVGGRARAGHRGVARSAHHRRGRGPVRDRGADPAPLAHGGPRLPAALRDRAQRDVPGGSASRAGADDAG